MKSFQHVVRALIERIDALPSSPSSRSSLPSTPVPASPPPTLPPGARRRGRYRVPPTRWGVPGPAVRSFLEPPADAKPQR